MVTRENLSHEMVWNTMLLFRDHSTWTGNRFELEVSGVSYALQRRGRQIFASGSKLKHKVSDSYFSRNDHAWIVIVRDFNFQDIGFLKDVNRTRLPASISIRSKTIDFEGDFDLFVRDYVIFKMFGDF